MRMIGALVVLLVTSGLAQAAIANPSYSSSVAGTGLLYVTGSISEASCSTSCSATFSVTLPKNYSSSAAVVFLRNYYIGFADTTAGRVNHAKIMLNRNSYTPSTGVFTWTVDVDLTAADPAPSDTTFNWGVDFGIALGDNTNFRATQRSATNFFQAGSGGSTPCDSSAECEDNTVYTGVGTTTAPFRQMLLRGFNVSTSQALAWS